MNNLQEQYNIFYDYVIEAVEKNEKNHLGIDDSIYLLGILHGGIAYCMIPKYKFSKSFLRENAHLQDDLNGDSITLHGKLYGDFIDEKYKLTFLEIVKKRDSHRLSLLVKDVVRSIINMRR